MQLFPERFVGVAPHPRWFEADPEGVAPDFRALIEGIPPLDILAALPPPPVPGVTFQPRGGNLSFYRPQSEWLDHPGVTVLPFAHYEAGLREIVDQFGGEGPSVELPQINAASGPLPELTTDEVEAVRAYYTGDLPL